VGILFFAPALTNNKVMFEELYVASCLTMLAAGLITILDGIWRG
jgi:hypothetical protein